MIYSSIAHRLSEPNRAGCLGYFGILLITLLGYNVTGLFPINWWSLPRPSIYNNDSLFTCRGFPSAPARRAKPHRTPFSIYYDLCHNNQSINSIYLLIHLFHFYFVFIFYFLLFSSFLQYIHSSFNRSLSIRKLISWSALKWRLSSASMFDILIGKWKVLLLSRS